MSRAWPSAAALVCGALLPLSLAPFGFWPLGILALAGWFALLRRPDANGAWLGWLFGVGKYGVGASWVYVSIHVYGNAPPPLAAFLVVLFVAGLALFTLANGWLFTRLATRRPWFDALLFAALFTGFEWLLTWVLTGFPWLYAGYAHLGTPLAGLAPLGGVLLVGFAVALTAVMLVRLADFAAAPGNGTKARQGRSRLAGAAGALGIAAAPWLLGAVVGTVSWVTPGAARDVALVQGNVDQSVKWQPDNRLPILRRYEALSEPAWGVDLLIWPEAALTFFAHQATPVLEALDARGEAAGTTLVLGIPSLERLPGGGVVFYNSARALGEGAGQYLKRRLVPFGEYVPLESLLRGAIEFFDLPMSRSAPGPWRQALLDVGGHGAVMAICYEVVYPDLVRAQAAAAGVLVTISNDSWFGASIGPLQHLEMARMRALENGRWMLRGTNNGVTAIIDHRGDVIGRLPQFEQGMLRGEYRVMEGTTPFTRWGHWPVLGLVTLILAAAAIPRRFGGILARP
ncbi:MAG: apolipoprotein N-acyltransferase [Gammaproteobacteria bacterium]|jgi:apolipoprotein N-acyltransferase|nr:apolipoprotein N-acyltransferase [Gammaproteobacteria bacterium]